MKVSGFTFVRNADKLYIPVKQSILSALPLCDEFVVALGNNDEDDRTEEIINSIGSEKIKIVRTQWDSAKFPRNTEYAHQTDIAKENCSGDWLIYVQSDEALHEDDYPEIEAALKHNFLDENVEGLLFHYNHFWGDYNHVHNTHGWYKKEMRIIRNKPNVHSWKDAQSFRVYDEFEKDNYKEYQRSEGTRKLRVKQLRAQVYHYGFARPPHIMSGKKKKSYASYHGAAKGEKLLKDMPDVFDYGPLDRVPFFKGTHPKVMPDWIAKFDWQDLLQQSGKPRKDREEHQHERLKYRLISFVENNILGGKTIFDFRNYDLIKD